METFEHLLDEVGIKENPDIENATAYLAVITEAFGELTEAIPNLAKRQTTRIGVVEFFIKMYEKQFRSMAESGHGTAPSEDDDLQFSKEMQDWGVVAPADQAVARQFLKDFTEIMLSNAQAMIADRKAVPIVLAAARKLLLLLQGGHV